MDRRIFVKLSAFSAAAISFSLLGGCQSQPKREMATPDLLSHMLEKDVLMEIGKGYVSQHDSEQHIDSIIPLLLADSKINASSDAQVIGTFLNDKIKNDFETTKTVMVNGWILSVTEARQCALFYLTHK
jgi:hypothetical protein